MFQTTNPATGETLKTYRHLNSDEIESVLKSARDAYLAAKSKPTALKIEQLKKIGAGFRKNRTELAKLMSLEMGKPLKDGLAEVEKSATACDYYAENLEAFLAGEPVKANYDSAEIVKDSIGPVLAIMPWNFPLWQVIRFAAPAVGIGNPILLKHSDLTAGSADKIVEIFDDVAKGLMFNMRVGHEAAAKIITDRRVVGVTLTGSARAGREVAKVAGENLKKSVLELGGSDAYVVFADSDVDKAAEICAQARLVNNGQSCVAGKRFLVEKSVMAQFLEKFKATLAAAKTGDPLDEKTALGPLAAKKFQEQLLEQCQKIEKAGAEKIFDADSKFDFKAPGAYFPARAYLVKSSMELSYTEELFGPVAMVYEFTKEDEALEIANKAIYGLGGAVFSKDVTRAKRFARLMECGFVAINDQVKSDARLPFGGVKDSGFGRELSLYGFNEFCNVKAVAVKA